MSLTFDELSSLHTVIDLLADDYRDMIEPFDGDFNRDQLLKLRDRLHAEIMSSPEMKPIKG